MEASDDNQRNETVWVLGAALLGFCLAMLALLGMIGGYLIVALLCVLAILAGLIAVAVIGIRGLAWGLTAAGKAIQALATRKGLETPAPMPVGNGAHEGAVIARVVEMQGSCARKIPYAVGNEFLLTGEGKAQPPLCNFALHRLRPYVTRLLAGTDGHVAKLQCPISGGILVFELRTYEPEEVAPERRKAAFRLASAFCEHKPS